MTDECIHLLDPATCTICNGRDARERKAAKTVVRTFTARYAGHCRCGDLIAPGAIIAELGDGQYVCEECAS
jgi:hypothetical protein